MCLSGSLCDRRTNVKLKGKVYKAVVRSALVHGTETLAVKKVHEKKLNAAEMRMSRWMRGVAKLDTIRNGRLGGMTRVGERSWKVQEKRLRWFCWTCNEKRRGLCGKKNDGFGSRMRWGWGICQSNDGRTDETKEDMEDKDVRREQTQDRAVWRRLVQQIDPTRSGIRFGRRLRL